MMRNESVIREEIATYRQWRLRRDGPPAEVSTHALIAEMLLDIREQLAATNAHIADVALAVNPGIWSRNP